MKIEAHVPFRFRALLTHSERRQLDDALDVFTRLSNRTVARLEKTVQEKHRIVRGSAFEGTFEYRDYDGEEGNISVEALMQAEFPGLVHDSGGVPIGDDLEPVEFIVTANFSVVLCRIKHRSRLFARRGLVEFDFHSPNTFTSIADAIVVIESANNKDANAFLAPISAEIVKCNLLGQ